jgi:serine/threonine protein kinase
VKDLTEALPTSREFSKQLKNQVKIIKKDPYKVYTLIEKIGKGATGNVYKAQNCQSGEIVALKQIELSRQFSKEKILNEIGMMMISSHPNILECFCAFEYQQ